MARYPSKPIENPTPTHSCEVVDKPEEQRVILLISGPEAFPGGPPLTLTAQEEELAALQEKLRFEKETGKQIFNFRRDPLAGGQKALRPPNGQMYRSGETRAEVWAVPTNGTFRGAVDEAGNLMPGVPPAPMSQGRVGPVTGFMQSNIKSGNATMVSIPGWVGEYI